jgi:hypothetical protein
LSKVLDVGRHRGEIELGRIDPACNQAGATLRHRAEEPPSEGRIAAGRTESLSGDAINLRTGESGTRMAGPALVEDVDDPVEACGLGLELAVVGECAYLAAQDEDGVGTGALIRRRDLHDEELQGPAMWLAPVLGDH